VDEADVAALESETPVVLGDGDMPVELDRINWGATLLTGLWLLTHGMWLWWFVDVAVLYGWLLVLSALRLNVGYATGMGGLEFLLAGIAVSVVRWAFWLWFGRHANAGVWRRESRRRARGMSGRSITGYRSVERWWAVAGAWIFLLGIIVGVAAAIERPAKQVGGGAGAAVSFAITAVFVGVAWVWDKRLAARARPHA